MNPKLRIFGSSSLSVDNSIDYIISDLELYKPEIAIFLFLGEYESPLKKLNDSKVSLEEVLVKNNIQFYHIVGSEYNQNDLEKYPKQNFHCLYWPTYLLHQHHHYMHKFEKYTNGELPSNEIKYLYYNYNMQPRLHRCMLMDSLSKHNLLDIGLNSWLILNKDYQFQNWKQEITKIEGDDGLPDTTHSYDYNTLFAIVGETCNDRIFISEKTFTKLTTATPFIAYGAQNQNKSLLKYGFELYDEIFDYAFDSSSILEERIQGVVDNLLSVKDKNWNELYELIIEKAIRNKKRAFEIIENDSFIPKELVQFYINNRDIFDDKSNRAISPNIFETIMKNKILI